MLFVNNEKYLETLKIVNGDKKLAPHLEKLRKFLNETYSASMYNALFEPLPHGEGGKKWRLYLILSSREAMERFYTDPELTTENKAKSEKIAEYFSHVYNEEKKLHRVVPEEIFVSYCDFSSEVMMEIHKQTLRAVGKRLEKEFGGYGVWRMIPNLRSLTVFYETEEKVLENQINGISAKLKETYCRELGDRDEFHLFCRDDFCVYFDSKENLDHNYHGDICSFFIQHSGLERVK